MIHITPEQAARAGITVAQPEPVLPAQPTEPPQPSMAELIERIPQTPDMAPVAAALTRIAEELARPRAVVVERGADGKIVRLVGAAV